MSSKSKDSVVRDFKDIKKSSSKLDITSVTNFNPDEYTHDDLAIGLETAAVAAVIDGPDMFRIANMIQSVMPNNERFSFDFDNLGKILRANFPNIRRKWYVMHQTIKRDSENREGFSHLRGLIDFLEYHRYTVITKDKYIDVTEDENASYNDMPLDVEVTTALFQAAKIADHIVFFGSDRKYEVPLKILHNDFGKTITVASALIEGRNTVPSEMRKVDNFVDLNKPWFIDRLNNKARSHLPRSFNPAKSTET